MSTSISTSAAIPAHVPSGLVFDFDFIADPRIKLDLHEGVRQVVAEAPPIFFTPRNGGHWVFAGYEAVFDAVRDTDLFSSSKMGLPPMEDEPRQIPISLDPPAHGVYRAVLNKAFSPKVIAALEGEIRKLTNHLIDSIEANGKCEFVHSIAEPLPVSIFMNMMGMPLDRLPEFRGWVASILSQNPDSPPEVGYRNVMQTMGEYVQARMQKRGDDLISRMLDADVGGRSPTFEEMIGFCVLLTVAGLDTVVNGMSFGIRHMAMDQQTQSTLRADPKLIPEAIEELLRRYTFTLPGRILAKDAEYGGVKFKEGDRVLLMLPAADLDETRFPNAAKFDLSRENKVHIAFNSGPHRCVGSHLARLEMKVLYEEWLRRIPAFSLDPAHTPTFHGGHVFGVDSLHIVWK